MAISVKGLRKIVGKRGAKIDWARVTEGERLRKRLLAQGLETRSFQTLSPAYGRRARIIDDPRHDTRLVRRSY